MIIPRFLFVLILILGVVTPVVAEYSSSPIMKKAMLLSQQGKWLEVIDELNKILAKHPDHPLALANLGVALGKLNKHKEALLVYERTLQLGYDNAFFRYNRGLSFAKLNLLDEAEKEILTALEMNPRMVRADYDLGIIYHLQGRKEDALKQVDKLYRRNENLAKKLFDALPSLYQIITVDSGGTLSGKVKMMGHKPDPRSFHLIHSPNIKFCSRISDGKGHRIVYDFKVSEQRGLKDTIIAFQNIDKGKPFPSKMYSFKISRCNSPDYVIGLRNGKDFLVENFDPIQHEIAVFELGDNFADQKTNKGVLPKTSQVRSIFVKKDSHEFLIKCGLHPFLQTQGFIVDNPYFAVTDSEGRYSIADIPPGTYEVVAWHPFIPIQKQIVTIGANQGAQLDFEFDIKDEERKLYQNDIEGYRFNTWYDSFENFYGGKRVDDPVEVLQTFE
ncbi:MAG: tetratricopeptide repeat protein [Nitrospinales bacterium]